MPINNSLEIELADVTEQNLMQFRTLNMSYLPVRYSDKFYRELLANTPKDFIKYGELSCDCFSFIYYSYLEWFCCRICLFKIRTKS